MRVGGTGSVAEGSSREDLGTAGEGVGTLGKASGLAKNWVESRGHSDTPTLKALSGVSDAAGLVSSGVSLFMDSQEADPFTLLEDGVGIGDGLSSLLNLETTSQVFSGATSAIGIFNGIRGAADDSKSTGERWKDGVGAGGDSLSLAGLLGGAPVNAELLATGLTELGLAGAMSAGGALISSFFLGKGAGDLWAQAGDSHWARDLNLGGYDDDGNKRTLGDFWTDVAVGANQGIDKAGRSADSFIDRNSRWLGDQVDDKIGFGGSAVEKVGDVLGDGVEIGADYVGGAVGGGIALGMGAAAGIADGASAAWNWMNSSSMSEEDWLEYERQMKSAREFLPHGWGGY